MHKIGRPFALWIDVLFNLRDGKVATKFPENEGGRFCHESFTIFNLLHISGTVSISLRACPNGMTPSGTCSRFILELKK